MKLANRVTPRLCCPAIGAFPFIRAGQKIPSSVGVNFFPRSISLHCTSHQSDSNGKRSASFSPSGRYSTVETCVTRERITRRMSDRRSQFHHSKTSQGSITTTIQSTGSLHQSHSQHQSYRHQTRRDPRYNKSQHVPCRKD